jgi:hypothetical protein
MPKSHGIHQKLPAVSGQRLTAAEAMVFRYGIRRVFDALRTGPFLADPDDRRKAAQLEYHFRTVCQRFVFTLQQLNGLMQELVLCANPVRSLPPLTMSLNFQAECLADHVLTYLNTMVDDVAIVIVLATGPSKANRTIDSMGKLRRPESRHEPAFALIKPLLDETDTPGSWWDLGFTTGTGARQLMIHNQHLVGFQLSSAPNGPMEIRSVVMSPFAQKTFACSDFFGLLRDILSGLFGWLDRLEAALVSRLQAKAVGWLPDPTCPYFLLPVGHPEGTTRYDREYFPIPLCDGSDELPWSVSMSHGREHNEA